MTAHLTAREALEELVEDLVHESSAVAVLFTGTGCHLSDEVEPKVGRVLREQFPLMRYTVVARTDAPHLVGQLNVADTPTLIIWFAGKETARFVRELDMAAMARSLEAPYTATFGG